LQKERRESGPEEIPRVEVISKQRIDTPSSSIGGAKRQQRRQNFAIDKPKSRSFVEVGSGDKERKSSIQSRSSSESSNRAHVLIGKKKRPTVNKIESSFNKLGEVVPGYQINMPSSLASMMRDQQNGGAVPMQPGNMFSQATSGHEVSSKNKAYQQNTNSEGTLSNMHKGGNIMTDSQRSQVLMGLDMSPFHPA